MLGKSVSKDAAATGLLNRRQLHVSVLKQRLYYFLAE